MKAKAVVLLSGGMDSTVVLAQAVADDWDVHAVSFCYGQRHRLELDAARAQAEVFGVASHRVVDLNLGQFGGSALTADIPVPLGTEDAASSKRVPMTYVPARNAVFLSVALSLAEAIDAHDIFIGVSAVDYSGYPDCRPAFIEAFEHMANLGTRAADGGPRFRVHTPLIGLTKAQTVELGLKLGVDFSRTRTCYDPSPNGHPCGRCAACCLRRKGFDELGIVDRFTLLGHD